MILHLTESLQTSRGLDSGDFLEWSDTIPDIGFGGIVHDAQERNDPGLFRFHPVGEGQAKAKLTDPNAVFCH